MNDSQAVIRCSRCTTSLKVRFQAGAPGFRVTCPKCGSVLSVKAKAGDQRLALIGDEPRDFRDFLVAELEKAGFQVEIFTDGRELLERAREVRPQLYVVNVYLEGMLGVEVCEAIKREPILSDSHVVLIGALFRANRYRSNPTNLYGADEYIEEVISADELQIMLSELVPLGGKPGSRSPDENRKLARVVVSDLILVGGDGLSRGLVQGKLDADMKAVLTEARNYFQEQLGPDKEALTFFDETLQDYIQRRKAEQRR